MGAPETSGGPGNVNKSTRQTVWWPLSGLSQYNNWRYQLAQLFYFYFNYTCRNQFQIKIIGPPLGSPREPLGALGGIGVHQTVVRRVNLPLGKGVPPVACPPMQGWTYHEG